MKAVIQRVKKASVVINSAEKRDISTGLVVFAGFGKDDTVETGRKVFDKIKKMRIFSNENGKFDTSVEDIKGAILIISQFTLYGECKKGNRPDFMSAAPYESGKKLYAEFLAYAKTSGLSITSGEFGADMLVELQNDGPVTIVIDSDNI